MDGFGKCARCNTHKSSVCTRMGGVEMCDPCVTAVEAEIDDTFDMRDDTIGVIAHAVADAGVRSPASRTVALRVVRTLEYEGYQITPVPKPLRANGEVAEGDE